MTLNSSDLRAFHQSCRALLIILLSPTIAGTISHFGFCEQKYILLCDLFLVLILWVLPIKHLVLLRMRRTFMLRVMSTAVLMIGDNDDHEDEYDNHVFLADSMWRPNTRALATRLSSWRARSSSPSTSSHLLIFLCWFSSTTMLSTICLT